MANKSKVKGTIAVGALVGIGVGYLAGILTAKKPGKETRKDIRNAALKAKVQTEKIAKTLLAKLNSLIKEAEDLAKKTKTTAESSLSKAIIKAKESKEKIREVLSALHEGDAEDKDLKEAINEATNAINHLKKYLKQSPSK